MGSHVNGRIGDILEPYVDEVITEINAVLASSDGLVLGGRRAPGDDDRDHHEDCSHDYFLYGLAAILDKGIEDIPKGSVLCARAGPRRTAPSLYVRMAATNRGRGNTLAMSPNSLILVSVEIRSVQSS